MSLEKRVYSSWAGKPQQEEMVAINAEIYAEIKDKCIKVYDRGMATPEMLATKCVILDRGSGYAHHKYQVLSNPHGLLASQLALFADWGPGALCFGYRGNSQAFDVYTD